jgi:RNA polymerase sigma-70 factor (ECF subfamily)
MTAGSPERPAAPTADPGRFAAPLTTGELEALYRQNSRRLFGLAWQLTGNAGEAEDAVQEAFLRALRGRDGYEERGRARAWLDRILVNVVRERGRRRIYYRDRVAPALSAVAPHEASERASPEAQALHDERAAAVLAALWELPPTFREVLVLRHFEERSTSEVATTLALPEATVRTRLKRAREMLVRRLEGGSTTGERERA